MKKVGYFVTGSRRGYVRVAYQGVEGPVQPIPDDLHGIRGNLRWALEYLRELGATHYTVADDQGVPDKGYSTTYCYSVYYGYTV